MSCTIKRILQLNEAIGFQPIKIVNDDDQDVTLQCQYSWSSDSVCWTNWVGYNDYLKIVKNLDSDFYLKILLSGSFKHLYINGYISTCYSVCIDSPNPFLQDFCGQTNLFQPYQNLDCALLLQQQMADSVICMFGIPVYYFIVNPRQETIDYTFKEFTMHDVVAVKQIKLMIEDGQMPSSNPKLNDFDFDWEVDWETEISKTQFAKAFGDTACPTSNDFLYIPMMKRMCEVNAAYDEKKDGLLWRSTTWKLQLTKYNDAKNVVSDGFDEIIDNWIVNKYEEQFGEYEKNEQERQSGTTQIEQPRFAATNLYNIFMEDAIRKQYTKQDISVIDKIYCHNNNIVARNIYKFKNENGCITYQKGICGDSGVLSFILETEDIPSKTLDKDIINFGPIDFNLSYDKNGYTISCEDLSTKLDKFTAYLVIYRWNRNNYTKELNIYKLSHDQDVPLYKLRPESYFFDINNPVCELVGAYNLDYDIKEPQPCQIHAYPAMLSNIKLYNRYMDIKESIKESIKYTTNDNRCVINDLARPINSGHGYVIK